MSKIYNTGINKDNFHDWILSCCDTFVRNEEKLYNLHSNGTMAIDVSFPLRAGEIPRMEIVINKIVQNEDHKIIVMRNLEDKENNENENKNGNEE